MVILPTMRLRLLSELGLPHIAPMSDPIEAAIFEKLAKADPKNVGGKSIEPADVAKELQPEQWQRMLPKVKATALGLMRQGRLTITKKGKVVDPNNFRGVIRLRLPTETETAAALAALPPVEASDDDFD
ncbi:DUF3253 domain-containing protein [Brevundimonas naejangsanensis]|uniref:DUF3253 domain-containing protein n=1 Tax=Brevundimonas naejangsanensis TaxID=588932 RepID=UPI003D031252